MKAVRVHEYGDANVLQVENDVVIPEISQKQVLIKIVYSSVNFIDTYFRSGLYPVPSFPKVLGQDGSGLIEKIGDQVPNECGLKVGDRVAFSSSSGSYAEYATVEYNSIVKLPSEISLKDSVACMINGLTAYYLAFDIPSVRSDVVLVHSAVGGTSRLLVQILSKIKKCKTIIGTVGSPEKVDLAFKLGCTHVIQYSQEDVAQKVREITNGKGTNVVFDGVGKDTYQASLDSLGLRGLFISFGNASGPVGLINPLDFAKRGSLNFTRPKLGDFITNFDELQEKSHKLFSWISQGLVDINIHKIFSLDEIKQAHNEIEGRKTVGKILLKVSEEP